MQVEVASFNVIPTGANERTRTFDAQFRKLLLYPSELHSHVNKLNGGTGGIRTRISRIKSPAFYPLKYGSR